MDNVTPVRAVVLEVGTEASDQTWSSPPEAGHYAAFGPFPSQEDCKTWQDAVIATMERVRQELEEAR